MDTSSALLRNQMYSIELRHLTPAQQEVVGLWLDLIADLETIPREEDFYGQHFSLDQMDFVQDSGFVKYKDVLLVMKSEGPPGQTDWRYLFKGDEIKRNVNDDDRAAAVERVSGIANVTARKLISDDFETLSKVQSPHHPRLIWRPYSGYFGPLAEHKTFIRIGMPLSGRERVVSSCIVMVMEARFDGRAIIELS